MGSRARCEYRSCAWRPRNITSHACQHNSHSMCIRAPDDCNCICHAAHRTHTEQSPASKFYRYVCSCGRTSRWYLSWIEANDSAKSHKNIMTGEHD